MGYKMINVDMVASPPFTPKEFSTKDIEEAFSVYLSTKFEDLPLLMGTEDRALRIMVEKALEKGHK